VLDLTPAPAAPDAGVALDRVLDLAAHTLGIGRARREKVRSARYRALETVFRAAEGAGSLRGSWRWGDFHLDRAGRRSCSDVDLYASTPTSAAATAAGGVLDTGIGPLRLAVHAVDYEPHVSLPVSYAFALVNLATARLGRDDDPYLLAKAQLMLARQHAGERYTDVAARVGTPAAPLLARKLGLPQRAQPAPGWAPGVEPAEPPSPLAPLLDQLLRGRPERPALEALRRYIENGLDDLDERHRRYVGAKVASLTQAIASP
jgi:hypothetical protein